MDTNLSPVLHGRVLKHIDMGGDSQKSAIKALKSCIKDLNSKTIPIFLAQVSEISEPGSSPAECTISLCEVLARVHGPNIVPYIDHIMSAILHSLSLSTGSLALHDACSNVIAAVARYGIDPLMTENEKKRVIRAVVKPLSDVLMKPEDTAASGAALCLQVLLESDNWQFASHDMVDDICSKVAGALEQKPTQKSSHLILTMALVKKNKQIVEPYARSLIRSGLRILTAGVRGCDSLAQLSAITMIDILMQGVDSRSISLEILQVVGTLEKVCNDGMHSVRAKASEVLETAKWIADQKGLSHEIFPNMITASKFKRETSRRYSWVAGDNENAWNPDCPLESGLPESQTFDSFIDCDNVVNLPLPTRNPDFVSRRHVGRRLWTDDNSRLDTELRDGFLTKEDLSDDNCASYFQQFRNDKPSEIHNCTEREESFPGFVVPTVNEVSRASTPRPQRTSIGIKISSSQQKLIQSVQDSSSINSWRLETPCEEDSYLQNSNCEVKGRNAAIMRKLLKQNDIQGNFTTDGIGSATSICNFHADGRAISGSKGHVCMLNSRSEYGKAALSVLCCFLMAVFAILFSARWIGSDDDFLDVVPT